MVNFEALAGFKFTRTTVWSLVVIIALDSDQQDIGIEWKWINRTMEKIHYYNYANAVLLSYRKDMRKIQMWTYDFFPKYHLKATVDVYEVIKDKAQNFMGVTMELKVLSYHDYEPMQIICNHFNSSISLEIFSKYKLDAFEMRNLLYPEYKNKKAIFKDFKFEITREAIGIMSSKIYDLHCLIIPRQVTSFSSKSFFTSNIKLMITYLLLFSFVWFVMTKVMGWTMRTQNNRQRDDGTTASSSNRSYLTILLYCLATITNVGVSIPHQSTADRIYLAGFLFFCFYAINSFQSVLISGLTEQPKFTQDIQSLAALNKTGVPIFITSNDYKHLNRSQYISINSLQNLKIKDSFNWPMKDLYREQAANNHPAYILNKTHCSIFVNSKVNLVNGERYFYAVEASIEPLFVSKFVPTSAPYRQNLEIYCLRLYGNGLYGFWVNNATESEYEVTGGKNNNVEDYADDAFVKFDDMKMLFSLPLIGGLLGLVTLIIEIFNFRYSEKRKKISVIRITIEV